MIQPDPSVLRFIDSYDNFIVMGHAEPDGDCICSSLAFASILNRYGKKAVAYNEGPFVRTDIQKYFPMLVPEIEEAWYSSNNSVALVIVDCSSLSRLGRNGENFLNIPTLVIDHHVTAEELGDARFVDPKSPSCTLLVQRLAIHMGMELTKTEAQMLFYGFSTDTGFFKHLTHNHYEEIKQMSELIKAGADPKSAFQQMSSGKSILAFKLQALLMNRSEFHHDKQIAFCYDTREDHEKYGEDSFNADLLYGQLLSISGIKAVVYLKYKDENYYSVGLRAVNAVNVGLLAQDLGGGGHKLASGAKVHASLEELKELVLGKIMDERYQLPV